MIRQAPALTIVSAALLSIACLIGQALFASTRPESDIYPVVAQPAQPTLRYFSSNTCANVGCHYQDKPFDGKGLQPICRCKEMEFWDLKDKHKIALSVLLDERSKKIGHLLGIKDVASDKRCVSCHGVWIEPQDLGRADEEFTKLETRIKEGVTCIVCHGPYKEWLDKHYTVDAKDRKDWRAKSRAEKESHFGMFDLWDPVKRTQLCASCHIGNADKGRFVTHEMYAAGHPPLPSFEVVTFSNQMPRHWQYLKEKDESILKLLKFNKREAELEETHLLAIGGLIAFQESLKLLDAHTAQESWPELAHFDCYACHHELTTKSWRQERGYAGKAGRPPLREWPTALVELGLIYAAKDEAESKKLKHDFQTRLKSLQAALDAEPFGDRNALRKSAEQLSKWIGAQVQVIRERMTKDDLEGGYAPGVSDKLLGYLVDLQSGADASSHRRPDFDSARQLAWAYQVLYLEATSKHEPKLRDQLRAKMQFSATWNKLDEYLGLSLLPFGQKKLEPILHLNLNRTEGYDPRQFFQLLDPVLKQFKGR